MNIETWPIERPVPYARNARKITPATVAKLAASLKEFGWRQPIVVDAEGVIIAGHTRLLAAKKLGLAEVPVHVAANLTPGQVKSYRIMDNRSHEDTEWDFELLAPELLDLQALDFDLALTGFETAEIGKLLDPAAESEDEEPEDAEVTEPPQIFGVILELASEEEQVSLLDEFNTRGLKCRALL